MRVDSLLELLPAYLHGVEGPYLLPAERALWERALRDEPCRLPEKGRESFIRAAFLTWLLTEERLKGLLPPSGLRIYGGRLIDSSAMEEDPLPAPLSIPHATLYHSLEMKGSELGGVYGPNAHTKALRFIQCRLTGPLLLENAILHGQLDLSDSLLGPYSIDLSESEIDGSLALSRTEFHALYAHWLLVKGSVQASQARVGDRLFLGNARVEGDLILSGAEISGSHAQPPQNSSKQEAATSPTPPHSDLRFVRSPLAGEEVEVPSPPEVPWYVGAALDRAQIHGQLDISGLHLFRGALSLQETQIGGNLQANNADLSAINLTNAVIQRTADFSRLRLSNYTNPPETEPWQMRFFAYPFLRFFAYPFRGRGMKVGGDLKLSFVEITGSLNLHEARIQGDLLIEGLNRQDLFKKKEEEEEEVQEFLFSVDYIDEDDTVSEEDSWHGKDRESPLLDPLKKLHRRIADSIISSEVVAREPRTWDIYLKHAEVGGRLVLKYRSGVKSVNLEGARVGILEDAERCWPSQGHLNLAGLQIGSFGQNTPDAPEKRIEWIRRQYPYRPVSNPLLILIGGVGGIGLIAILMIFYYMTFHDILLIYESTSEVLISFLSIALISIWAIPYILSFIGLLRSGLHLGFAFFIYIVVGYASVIYVAGGRVGYL